MFLKHKSKNSIIYIILFKVKLIIKQFLFYFPNYINKTFSTPVNSEWEERINITKLSPDLIRFNSVPNAGKIINGKLIMHNGIKVFPLSYYNKNYYNLLSETKGIHEPQEELIFSEILKLMPQKATMIELGSYWAFYSMWFNKTIQTAKNYMIEPELPQLLYGKYNFMINNCRGEFYQAFIDSYSKEDKHGKVISVDDFIAYKKISHVNLLHSDIQGYEENMLIGAAKGLKNELIDFIFISTHCNQVHYDCIKILKDYNYKILCSINIDESFSVDGLIVACSSQMNIPKNLIKLIESIKKRN